MAAKILTSLTFRGKTLDELRAELSDFSSNLYDFASGLVRDFAARPRVSALNPTTIGFGQLHKFDVAYGAILDAQLPRPDTVNGGLAIHITRATTTGTIVLHAPGCFINGRSSVRLPASVGLHIIFYDGANYYATPLALDWVDGL